MAERLHGINRYTIQNLKAGHGRIKVRYDRVGFEERAVSNRTARPGPENVA
jgi:hypothetical protein